MDIAAFGVLVGAGLVFASSRAATSVPAPAEAGSPWGKSEAVFTDPNCPHDAEGRVHHLHVKAGEGECAHVPPELDAIWVTFKVAAGLPNDSYAL